MLLEELGDLRGGPRFVAELHGCPDDRGKARQEAFEELPAVHERRGELEQDDAEPVPQAQGPADELVHVAGGVDQPPDVRDPLGGLERQTEPLRRLRPPPLEHGIGGKPAEGVVDLHRREHARIVRQHLLGGKIGWIEMPLPLGIVVAGRADPDHVPHRRQREDAHPPARDPGPASAACAAAQRASL